MWTFNKPTQEWQYVRDGVTLVSVAKEAWPAFQRQQEMIQIDGRFIPVPQIFSDSLKD